MVAVPFHAAMYRPQAALVSELASTGRRCSGGSLSDQIVGVLGGVLTPIASVALLDWFGTWVAVSLTSPRCC